MRGLGCKGSEVRVHRLGFVEFLRTENVVMQEQLQKQRIELALRREGRNVARVLEYLHITVPRLQKNKTRATSQQLHEQSVHNTSQTACPNVVEDFTGPQDEAMQHRHGR